MTTSAPICFRCGKAGLYEWKGHSVCAPCMFQERPPLRYDGPERRRRDARTAFTRRNDDSGIGRRLPD